MTTQSSNKKTITSLPDLCLLTIFDTVPLMDVLSNVSLTCHRWHSLRHSVLTRRTRLYLKVGEEPNENTNINESEIDLDCLTCSVLCPKRVNLLMTAFVQAKICTLSVSIRSKYGGDQLTESMNLTSLSTLLFHWARVGTLHTLRLDVPYTDSKVGSFFGPHLVQAIEAVGLGGSLRLLAIDPWLISPNQAAAGSAARPFPLLSRLHHLELLSQLPSNLVAFCRWVGANYAQNAHLTISLNDSNNQSYGLDYLQREMAQIVKLACGRTVLAMFTCFPPINIWNNSRNDNLNFVQATRNFFLHLSGLTRVDRFPIGCKQFAQMTRSLSNLPHLRELELLYTIADNEDGGGGGNASNITDHRSVLASVRVLKVTLTNLTYGRAVGVWQHRQPECQLWGSDSLVGVIFPGLEVLHLSYYYGPYWVGDQSTHGQAAPSPAMLASVLRADLRRTARPFVLGCSIGRGGGLLRQVIFYHTYYNVQERFTPEQVL